jgi:hypothetical protein
MKETRILRNVVVWDPKAQQAVEIDLDVEVDLDWIGQQLAPKAYKNKARRSSALHGLVEVRVRGTKATPLANLAKPLSAMAGDL